MNAIEMANTCYTCGNPTDGEAQFTLVEGRLRRPHCSEACLQDTVDGQRRARAARNRRRLIVGLAALALIVVGAGTWRRLHAPASQSISLAWPEVHPDPTPRPELIFYGPAWPPTDDDWKFAFAKPGWMFPLPGPTRRAPAPDGRIFGPEPPRHLPASCRTRGVCGVDLGGELWGEHVYAARDGVVDRVYPDGNHPRGGATVRLAHYGGLVFTQYFHLAAIPRGITRGAHVAAGDVIGLVGDTGLAGERRHLHFALSVRPSAELPEVYWDPTPFMPDWPLRVPLRGTVAGLAPSAPRGSK